jgi:hypothetical protein
VKCPYCAEDFADAALVCKHCGRDFLFIRPLWEKIQTLEADLRSLREAFLSLRQRSDAVLPPGGPNVLPTDSNTYQSFTKKFRITAIAIAVFTSVIAMVFVILLNVHGFPDSWRELFWLSALVAIALGGFIEGFYLRTAKWYLSVLYSAFTIPIVSIGLDIVFIIEPPGRREYLTAWIDVFVVLPFLLMLLFLSSTSIGRWLSKRRKPSPTPQALPLAIALAQIGPTEERDILSKRVEVWTKILAALTPILAVIATIVTGYFSYLAAVAAAVAKK